MPTASRDIVVRNKLGLHARPAMQFVDLAGKFKSNVRVTAFGQTPQDADGKSVMQMIILAAEAGTRLRIAASGEDADAAVNALYALIENGFGEEMTEHGD